LQKLSNLSVFAAEAAVEAASDAVEAAAPAAAATAATPHAMFVAYKADSRGSVQKLLAQRRTCHAVAGSTKARMLTTHCLVSGVLSGSGL
jgi:hypothetical protein